MLVLPPFEPDSISAAAVPRRTQSAPAHSAMASRGSFSDVMALAAANARNGQFNRAVEIVTDAIDEIKKLNSSDKIIPKLEKMLQLYKNNQPFTF